MVESVTRRHYLGQYLSFVLGVTAAFGSRYAVRCEAKRSRGGAAMKSKTTVAEDVDAYIAGFPKDVQKLLRAVRATIKKAAPGATEKISYQIPCYVLHANLVYFAAFKKHISLYPAPRTAPEFKDELAAYEGGKGTVQFPFDKPLPLDLIARIVTHRAKENEAKAAAKTKRK